MMLTKYLARVMGLWIVLTVLGMAFTRETSVATIDGIFMNPALMWVTGIFTMLVGLIVVGIHNRWSGGALPVIVTLYGWIALLKGLAFVWLPPAVQTAAWQSLHFDRFFWAYIVVALLIGGYLIYGGFRSEPPTETIEVEAIEVTPDTWPTVPRG